MSNRIARLRDASLRSSRILAREDCNDDPFGVNGDRLWTSANYTERARIDLDRPRRSPARRLCRWLFVSGGAAPVFLGGVILFAFTAWMLGYQ